MAIVAVLCKHKDSDSPRLKEGVSPPTRKRVLSVGILSQPPAVYIEKFAVLLRKGLSGDKADILGPNRSHCWIEFVAEQCTCSARLKNISDLRPIPARGLPHSLRTSHCDTTHESTTVITESTLAAKIAVRMLSSHVASSTGVYCQKKVHTLFSNSVFPDYTYYITRGV